MTAAILSDIHANKQALEAVLEDVGRFAAGEYWILGDLVDYGANPNEVIEMVQALPLTRYVGGNHDISLFSDQVIASRTPHGQAAHRFTRQTISRQNAGWLEPLCRQQILTCEPEDVTLVHGSPLSPYWGYIFPGEDEALWEEVTGGLCTGRLCVGHSHLQFQYPLPNGRCIYNPGSVGQPRNLCPKAQYMLYRDGEFLFRQVDYDIEGAAQAIRKARLPAYLSERLYEGR